MKRLLLQGLIPIILLAALGSLMIACQPVSTTSTPVVLGTGATGSPTLPLETPASAPTEIGSWPLSPDRHLMVAQTRDGAWWMWDASTRRPVYLLNDTVSRAPQIHNPTFSPDGQYLAAISLGHVLLWEVATHKRRLLMPPAAKDYRSLRWLTFSPNSHLLATSSCEKLNNHSVCEEGFVSLWNTADGTLAHTLPTGFRVDTMKFSPDGSTLTISGCSRTDGTIGYYCYEQSEATFRVDSGERIALTRVPQFK